MTEKKDEDPVETALTKLKPLFAKLSFGAVMGYCSGYALKKVGKALAVVIGVGFIGIQSAVATGYIKVDWDKMSNDVVMKIDTSGDGKLDVDDAKEYWRRLRKMLTNRIPGAGGFGLGFLWGVKSG